MANEFKNHRLYEGFKYIQNKLAQHQFVCWIVGGAVRDIYLGHTVHELDLVTDASTEAVKALFSEAILVGESFGVVKIPFGPERDLFDLATFREESDYIDGRRPSLVKASTPTLDAQRRDFTVNALYWDDTFKQVWDFVAGVSDLQLMKLRTVGAPEVRFNEDFLRVMRLARFSAQLGFNIEAQAEIAALQCVPFLVRISGERIWSEFKKIETHSVWPETLKIKLMQNILVQILEVDALKFDPDGLGQEKHLKTVLILSLIAQEKDLSLVLQSRLKVSRAELDEYQKYIRLLKLTDESAIEDLYLELEINAKLLVVWQNLIELGFLDKNWDEKYRKLIQKHPEPLLKASGLVGIIPDKCIGTAIQEIRLLQWREVCLTPDHALVYLKKKYANINEKP